ncbi:hypothetical protein [Mycoplasma feriruminatoris]|uniref:Lipoprotein n=1 Tax=Mycoplasma feriruminatoris TaxID=1179777 RepID=A0A654IL40_9MOLU|nr:hypothetical protein [Mycoplasma feriruminatoris]WFQ90327.1 hypothetical protein MFERI11561_00581 [Mycoplasma feriruminatoris]VZR98126.1 hypothetical protein MF5295_00636 [Mycoplasma feriruminatoris]
MKKIICVLATALVVTTSFLVVSCKAPSKINSKIEITNIDEPKDDKNNIKKNKQPKNEFIESSNNEKVKEEEKKGKIGEILGKDKEKNKKNVQEELMLSDAPKKIEIYKQQKDKKTNFQLIKKYGKELTDFAFSNQEKLEKLKGNSKNDHLFLKIKAITDPYVEMITKYANIEDLEEKLKSDFEKRKENTKAFSDFLEDLYNKWDEAVVEYEKEESNIWKLLKSI